MCCVLLCVLLCHRRVLSGEFTVVNQHLLADLTQLGLWNPMLKNELVAANGSVQVRHQACSTVVPKLACCVGVFLLDSTLRTRLAASWRQMIAQC